MKYLFQQQSLVLVASLSNCNHREPIKGIYLVFISPLDNSEEHHITEVQGSGGFIIINNRAGWRTDWGRFFSHSSKSL